MATDLKKFAGKDPHTMDSYTKDAAKTAIARANAAVAKLKSYDPAKDPSGKAAKEIYLELDKRNLDLRYYDHYKDPGVMRAIQDVTAAFQKIGPASRGQDPAQKRSAKDAGLPRVGSWWKFARINAETAGVWEVISADDREVGLENPAARRRLEYTPEKFSEMVRGSLLVKTSKPPTPQVSWGAGKASASLEKKPKGPSASAKDLVTGTILVNKAHPEWGSWSVKVDGRGDITVSNSRGTKALDPGEASDWIVQTRGAGTSANVVSIGIDKARREENLRRAYETESKSWIAALDKANNYSPKYDVDGTMAKSIRDELVAVRRTMVGYQDSPELKAKVDDFSKRVTKILDDKIDLAARATLPGQSKSIHGVGQKTSFDTPESLKLIEGVKRAMREYDSNKNADSALEVASLSRKLADFYRLNKQFNMASPYDANVGKYTALAETMKKRKKEAAKKQESPLKKFASSQQSFVEHLEK